MKRLLLILLCGLIFMLLQTTFFPRFFPSALRINLLLILVIYLALNESFMRAALMTFLFGALQDVFSGATFGLYATVQLSVFLLIRLFSARLNVESRRLLLGLVAAGTILQAFMLGFFLTTFAEAGSVLGILLSDLPAQLFGNLLAGWLLLLLLLRFQPIFGARQGMAGLSYQSKHHGA